MNPQAQKLLKIVGLIMLLAIIGWLTARDRQARTERGADSKVASNEAPPPPMPPSAVTPAGEAPVEAKAFVRPAPKGTTDVAAAFLAKQSGVMVAGAGRVKKLLPDDAEGSPHQKFIVSLAGGRTVLITHNTDLAARVPLHEGDTVEFQGQFEWNDQGGLVHWTHRDPAGRHAEGWIRHDGKTYQ